jgi:hypothetical protein
MPRPVFQFLGESFQVLFERIAPKEASVLAEPGGHLQKIDWRHCAIGVPIDVVSSHTKTSVYVIGTGG